MFDDQHDHVHGPACTAGAPRAARPAHLSRRRLLGAFAVGVGVYGVARLPVGANGSQLDSLAGPGQALEPADRLPHPPPTAPEPEPETEPTTPELTFVEPEDGEILFPILVGEDDWCFVLDNYGDARGCCRLHEGVDIMADEGLTVISSSAGVITRKYTDSGLTYGAGNGWTIEDEENDVVYRYFHLAEHAPDLEVGDTVELGQPIGTVGETGTSGAGTSIENFHLHYEWRPNNVARNSFDVLQRPEFVRWQG